MCDVYNEQLICKICDYFEDNYCSYHERKTDPNNSCGDAYGAKLPDEDVDEGFLTDDKEKD